LSAPSVQWHTDARPGTSRGRHRGPSGAAKVKATGTVAVSGVALAGCADPTVDAWGDDSSVTSGLALASAFGAAGGGSGGAVVKPASFAQALGSASVSESETAPTLTGKTDVALEITNPDVTVYADEPVEIGFRLYNEETKEPIPNQLVKVQVKLPTGFATFLHLQTNDEGYTSYTARVLTTTQITAVFDGTDKLQSATAERVGTLHVRERPVVRSVSSPTVIAPSNGTLGEKVVYLASLQQGKPYVYGAEGPNSFDCSGLVQYVYKQLGRYLPRTAQQQYDATLHIDPSHKEPGDLIFFGGENSIYHVGIYAGDGKMWVAPQTGETVQLRTIWTTNYKVGRVL
jgi:cell wall-associated NlpC family hydrolase